MSPTMFVYKRHIETICAKAFRNFGLVKRNCTDMSYTCRKVLYFALRLEFGSLIWNPRQTGLIDRMDKIQRNFVRTMAFKLNLHGLYQLPTLSNSVKYPIQPKTVITTMMVYFYTSYLTEPCPEILNLIGFKALPVNTGNKALYHVAPSNFTLQ